QTETARPIHGRPVFRTDMRRGSESAIYLMVLTIPRPDWRAGVRIHCDVEHRGDIRLKSSTQRGADVFGFHDRHSFGAYRPSDSGMVDVVESDRGRRLSVKIVLPMALHAEQAIVQYDDHDGCSLPDRRFQLGPDMRKPPIPHDRHHSRAGSGEPCPDRER